MPITLTKLKGKPIGPNSSFLVNDMGFVVRTYAPLNVKQWRNVEKKDVDKMIERINSKYDIDMSLTHVSIYIKNALQKWFVDFRHKLKKHFDSFPTLEEAKQNKHEDVTSQEEWNFLCDHYASDQFKERSNKNAINRSHLTYNHKGGSKSFRAHEEDIEAKTREQLSAIDYFEVVHKNTKNGWDEGAQLKWEEMLSMKNETTLPKGTVTLTDDEIVLGVLAHKFGYFKELVTTKQELVETKQELVETKQELGEAKQAIQELKENQKKFKELLHKIMEGQQPPP
ncbi:hypothetical protein PS2_000180 [Malus domestica]